MPGITDFLFNGSPPASTTTYSTSTANLPTWYSDYTQGLLSKANSVAAKDYQTYEAPLVADFNGAQKQAFNMTSGSVNNWTPSMSNANAAMANGLRTDPRAAAAGTLQSAKGLSGPGDSYGYLQAGTRGASDWTTAASQTFGGAAGQNGAGVANEWANQAAGQNGAAAGQNNLGAVGWQNGASAAQGNFGQAAAQNGAAAGQNNLGAVGWQNGASAADPLLQRAEWTNAPGAANGMFGASAGINGANNAAPWQGAASQQNGAQQAQPYLQGAAGISGSAAAQPYLQQAGQTLPGNVQDYLNPYNDAT